MQCHLGSQESYLTGASLLQKEKSYKVNLKIDETLIEAESELEAVPSDSSASSAVKIAQDALTQDRKLIGERQKLIKIADCSKLGWAVV